MIQFAALRAAFANPAPSSANHEPNTRLAHNNDRRLHLVVGDSNHSQQLTMASIGATSATPANDANGANFRGSFAIITSLFFLWGCMTMFNDILILRLKEAFTLSFFQAMLVQFAFFGACFVGALIWMFRGRRWVRYNEVVMKIFITNFTLLAANALPAAELRLPDPLTTAGGDKVTSAEMWRQARRPEILEMFRTHVYGRMPVGRPASLKFEVRELVRGVMDGAATRKQVKISYRGPGGEGAVNLVLFTPVKGPPAPCFLLICNRGATNIDPSRAIKSSFWPAEQIVARGYAAAAFLNEDVDPDRHDGFTNGVHGVFDSSGAKRPGDAWGSIAAWAWGASRAMDYLETDADIDARRVAVIGHSRAGKTALWAGAEDERFALVISNNSGCGGAALARRRQPNAETIQAINRNFPHWFCENYRHYGGKEDDLPVDQHMLAALIAPRLLYIASATEDLWADPEGEFLSGVEASPVYRLFGLEGLKADRQPSPDTPVQEGAIGYHLRTGKHDLTEYDWKCYLDFADKHLARHTNPGSCDSATEPSAPEQSPPNAIKEHSRIWK